MNGFHHAIVWIDHSEAKVYRFSDEAETAVDVHSHTSLQRLHHRSAGWEADSSPPEDTEFYQRITGVLDPTGSIVICGPGNAKINFKAFLDHFRPSVAVRVSALETMKDPGADAMLALGRRYFKGEAQPQSAAAAHSPL